MALEDGPDVQQVDGLADVAEQDVEGVDDVDQVQRLVEEAALCATKTKDST